MQLQNKNMHIDILLFLAGLAAGIINAVAGGGGIIIYPALLVSGLSPLIANATSSLVVWPGTLMSAYGYRDELKNVPRYYIWLALPALLGSIVGAVILTRIDSHSFERLAPWLVFSAVLLLALQSRIHRWLSKQTKRRKIHWHTMPLMCMTVFPLAIYGGFFGVGFGLMMLAVLGFSSLKNIHQMNGVKNLVSAVMAIVATVYFAHEGLIDWNSGLLVSIGTAIGGYTGARMSQKVSAHAVHDFTVVTGLIISLILIMN